MSIEEKLHTHTHRAKIGFSLAYCSRNVVVEFYFKQDGAHLSLAQIKSVLKLAADFSENHTTNLAIDFSTLYIVACNEIQNYLVP
jgi:hypothetical protein